RRRGGSDEPPHQLQRLLRRMLRLLTHAVGERRYFDDIARLGAEWIGLPDVALATVARALRLWMRRIAQRVGIVRDAGGVNVEREVAPAQVEDAFVAAAPVAPEVGLVAVVPDEPAAGRELPRGGDLEIGQNLGKSAY